MSQVYLTLPSDSSGTYHPDNRAAEYTTKLHCALELGEGEWEVGLSEIIYPNTWFTLSDEEQGRMELLNTVTNQTDQLDVEVGYYPTMQSLCNKVSTALGRVAVLHWQATRQKALLVFHKPSHMLRFSNRLSRLLGLPEVVWTQEDPDHGDAWEGERVWDPKQGLGSMYVCCGLANCQLVGDGYAPLLRIVPIRGNHGEVTARSFTNIHYVPAKAGRFENVEVNIRDALGNFTPFHGGRLVLVLHLRKANLPHLNP